MPADRVCDICGSTGHPWLSRQGRTLVRCDRCGYGWVREGLAVTAAGLSIYEDASRALFDEQADYYLDEGALDAARDKLTWVRRHVGGGRLLDVGAGFGHFVHEASASFDATGIEPSPLAIGWARQHFSAPIVPGGLDAHVNAYEGRFDVITMFDVIEHLERPRAALQNCHRYLRSNGWLFLSTPDFGSLMARALGRHWYYLDLEQHVSLFAASHLTTLLQECGFDVVERRTFGRRYRASYVRRRLLELGRENTLLKLAGIAAAPLRLVADRHLTINLGDVMGIAARRRS
jgi:2-polyprenyl-3-methyl-5-hydroxy-6-metoxy-1,4-benzoquinol methylase